MPNTTRYYKWVSIATVAIPNSQSAAAANTTAINALALTYKGTDTALYVPAGVWWYSGVLTIDSAAIFGEGDTSILQGSDGTNSPQVALKLTGTRPSAKWLTVKAVGATLRNSADAACGVWVINSVGHILEQVNVIGAAGAGFMLNNAKYGYQALCTCSNVLADGFHETNQSANLELDRCTASNVGDDYFAVVSYQSQGSVCTNVLTHDFNGLGGQTTGRGATVVGGSNIIYRAGYVEKCAQFGLYAAQEIAYTTLGTQSCTFSNITVNGVGVVNAVNGYGVCTNSDDPAFPVSSITFTGCVFKGTLPQTLVSVRANCSSINTAGVTYG